MHDAHALAPASGRGLDHDGEADLLGGSLGRIGVRDVLDAGHHGHLRLQHRASRRDLVPHDLHGLARRTDEDDARLLARGGERSPLAEEAIAGVDGLRPAASGNLEDPLGNQVALASQRRTDAIGLVGIEHVRRTAIRFAEHGDRRDSVLATGSKDTASNLATVGHEYLAKRRVGHGREPGLPDTTGPSDALARSSDPRDDGVIELPRRKTEAGRDAVAHTEPAEA